MPLPDDFVTWLKSAVIELRSAGHDREADELEGVITSAWTTLSEMYGKAGFTIKKITKKLGTKLPKHVRNHLDRSMKEIHKVWPWI